MGRAQSTPLGLQRGWLRPDRSEPAQECYSDFGETALAGPRLHQIEQPRTVPIHVAMIILFRY